MRRCDGVRRCRWRLIASRRRVECDRTRRLSDEGEIHIVGTDRNGHRRRCANLARVGDRDVYSQRRGDVVRRVHVVCVVVLLSRADRSRTPAEVQWRPRDRVRRGVRRVPAGTDDDHRVAAVAAHDNTRGVVVVRAGTDGHDGVEQLQDRGIGRREVHDQRARTVMRNFRRVLGIDRDIELQRGRKESRIVAADADMRRRIHDVQAVHGIPARRRDRYCRGARRNRGVREIHIVAPACDCRGGRHGHFRRVRTVENDRQRVDGDVRRVDVNAGLILTNAKPDRGGAESEIRR